MRRAEPRGLRAAVTFARSVHRVETTRTGSPAECGDNFTPNARAQTEARMRLEMNQAGPRNEGARDGIMIVAKMEIESPMSAIARQGFAMQRAARRGGRATVELNRRKR